MEGSQNLETELPSDPATSPLGTHLKGFDGLQQRYPRIHVHRCPIHNNREVESAQMPTTAEWKMKMWYTCAMEF